MCGIAGVIDFAGRPIPREVLARLADDLRHRGPDDAGTFVYESPGFSAGLAHTRLAVIDPTPDGRQPFGDPTGRWAICYNGELYNYRELRSSLPPPFRTACDTEVVLKACMTWGASALPRFDAMWALAVLDTADRAGHLSRDPIGIKPLYYAHAADRLVFASELKALARTGLVPLEVDPDAVSLYLHLGYIPHPWTIYRGVCKLPPGHRLDFDSRGSRPPERFYRLSAPPGRVPPYPDACRELRTRIEAAVSRQKVADVPLGAFLSGGLDSSVVVAALTRTCGGPIKTFSIGYPEHPRYDESDYARLVARRFGTDHHEFAATFRDVLATIEPMLGHLGEPFADSSLLPAALVSRLTRGHVTVALSGDGGDELFGGYFRYLGHAYLDRYRRCPAIVRRGILEPLLRLVPSARTSPRLDRLRQVRKLLRGEGLPPVDRHVAWARFLDPPTASALLGAGVAAETARRLVPLYLEASRSWRADAGPDDPIEAILLADLALSLPADMLHKVDTAGMYHGLEVRVPLLASEVVEFAAGLPIAYRLRGTATKRILRDAFRDVLPRAVRRRRKMGFEVPVGEFLRRELRPMYEDTVVPAVLGEFGLTPAAARRVYEEHLARRRDHTELLWALLVLCRWRRSSRPARA